MPSLLSTLLITILLGMTSVTALTVAEVRKTGDCALGTFTTDANGQVTGCGQKVIPVGFVGDYVGLDGKL